MKSFYTNYRKNKILPYAKGLLLLLSLIILLISVVYVGHESAVIQSNNNDQLVVGYLFENNNTFKQAVFPSTHTFLIKWPLFALSAMYGNSLYTYQVMTIGLFLVTIFGFVLIIYYLCRDKVITSVASLALASILLLVPSQPSDAVLLVVNMAMITTRNIEFLVFFAIIYLFLKGRGFKSYSFLLASVLIILLEASDNYFLMLFGLATLLDLLYTLWKTRQKISIKQLQPLVLAFIGSIGSAILLFGLNATHLGIIDKASSVSPYSIVNSVSSTLPAIAGAIQGTLVNFGADIFGKPVNLHLLPYLFNGLLLIVGIVSVRYVYFKLPEISEDSPLLMRRQFGYWLVLSTIAAYIMYVISQHDFQFDSRYLTITLFTGVTAMVLAIQEISVAIRRKLLTFIAVGILVTLPLTFITARSRLNETISANYMILGNRTSRVADILRSDKITILAGDYWFVGAVKAKYPGLSIVPMSTNTCDLPNTFLTSGAWYKPVGTANRSAYYLLRDGDNGTTYNNGCSLDYLKQQYGNPVQQIIVSGTPQNPTDILQIYAYDLRVAFHRQ